MSRPPRPPRSAPRPKPSAPRRSNNERRHSRADGNRNEGRRHRRRPFSLSVRMPYHFRMKIIGIAGYSGSGKTTLSEKVIPVLVREGLRVSLIKHAHHEFDVDQPGKDSHRHRHAGCAEVLVSSSKRWALMHELRGATEPTLQDQLKKLSPCDVVIVEGYKAEAIPKVEVHRREARTPLLHLEDPNVVAVATDQPLETALPQFALGDAEGVARFIIQHLGLNRARLVR